MKLFLAGQFVAETEHGRVWEFSGIFDSREKAVGACVDSKSFVASVDLNILASTETADFPDCEYPLYKYEEVQQ